MSVFEIVLTLLAATASGSLIAAARYLRDIRNDAATALRILTGEDEVEEDRGLVYEVDKLSDRVDRIEQRVTEHNRYSDEI
jgi:hypothetical protein